MANRGFSLVLSAKSGISVVLMTMFSRVEKFAVFENISVDFLVGNI